MYRSSIYSAAGPSTLSSFLSHWYSFLIWQRKKKFSSRQNQESPKMPPKTRPRKPPSPRQLKEYMYMVPGSRVEISSNDDGFQGSWFLGKIVRRFSGVDYPPQFLVEYDTIFTDQSGKKPVRETVDYYQVRPPAPREKNWVFKFGEEVDAYHNDGWWEGSITEDLGGGRFAVFFRKSKEQIVFDGQDLRLHREWEHEDGTWKPPLEEDEDLQNQNVPTAEELNPDQPVVQQESALPTKRKRGESQKCEPKKLPDSTPGRPVEGVEQEKFHSGMLVEVSNDEDGFQGAWFTATIVEEVGTDKYLVEYQTLRTDDDTEFLKEEAEAVHIRPSPPDTIVVDRFKLHDEVDVWYNDGWWVGVISKIRAEAKYEVYFKESDEILEFDHSDLRLHQEWVNGKWIMPSKFRRS